MTIDDFVSRKTAATASIGAINHRLLCILANMVERGKGRRVRAVWHAGESISLSQKEYLDDGVERLLPTTGYP